MPSFYDADFARHDEAMLAQDFGELVVYKAPDGSETPDELAIVDWEAQASGGTDEGVTTRHKQQPGGIVFVRVRRFGLRLSAVPEVELFGSCLHANKEWPITRIMGSDVARTYVECEREEDYQAGAGYFGP